MLSDPILSANVYCSGRLCEVIERLVQPVWQEIQELPSQEVHLWIMRYARCGEHLKIRIHGPSSLRPVLREILENRQRDYFSSLIAEPVANRHARGSCPPIDVEDGAAGEYPDRTFLWTTYRRSYVSFGYQPYIFDTSYISLLIHCLAGSTEIVLRNIRVNKHGRFPALLQKALLLRATTAAISRLFPASQEKIQYLIYHRDTLLRAIRNRGRKFFDPAKLKIDRVHDELSKIIAQGSPQGLDAELWQSNGRQRADMKQWCRWLESLRGYLVRSCQSPGHHIDPFAEDRTFPCIFKALHGFANQLGVDPLNEAFVYHLSLSPIAEEQVFVRPIRMRPELPCLEGGYSGTENERRLQRH